MPCFRKFLHFVIKRVQNAVFRMFADFFAMHAWIKGWKRGKGAKYIVFQCLSVILRNRYDLELFEQKAK